MLIPSIDLQGGKIVQLVQGERLAVETSDVDAWIQKFAAYPKVQLIDLDAAKGAGNNESLVARICRALPCRVGGGIRTIERAQAILALGARKVILGSSLFTGNLVNIHFARDLSDQIGPDRLIAAVDGKGVTRAPASLTLSTTSCGRPCPRRPRSSSWTVTRGE